MMTGETSDRNTEAASPGSAPLPAAQYVRMSTEHQRYSTHNQAEEIGRYAEARGYQIVRTYSDEGKSGLTIDGRAGLKRLLSDVEEGTIGCVALIVYDVSRWGRFQDPDEAAAYELRCRRAGISVHYCAEQFENDGSISSSIIKTVKRAMAGEYSRELSVKVFAGQANLVRLGFRQGGMAGYGLRRLLVDEAGKPKLVLDRGQQKSIATDRVILTKGPAEEVEVIREVYDLFLKHRMTECEIAAHLNARGVLNDQKRRWSRGTVHSLLINEKYAGDNVWARGSQKLKQKRVLNDREQWVRADNVFPAIVARDTFNAVQAIIGARSAVLNDEQMLVRLRDILAQYGTLTGLIIDEVENAPSSSAYRSRFGSLLRAYTLVGFQPDFDYSYIEINRRLRSYFYHIVDEIVTGVMEAGGGVEQDPKTGLLQINGEFSVSIVIARCVNLESGRRRWRLRFEAALKPDLTIGVRMDSNNDRPRDFYLFPMLAFEDAVLPLGDFNGVTVDAFRFDSLKPFYRMAARVPIRVAA